jgi:O-antigen ligase
MASLLDLPGVRRAPGRRQRARQADAVGLLLLVVAAGWTLVAAADHPRARPAPVLLLLAGLALLTCVGRRSPGASPGLLPGLVAVGITGSLVLGFPDVLRSGGSPTGYANSNAALASLGAVAAAAATALTEERRTRQAWALLGALLALAVVATGSIAAVVALGVASALALLAILIDDVTAVVSGGVVVVSVVLGITLAVAVGGDPVGLADREPLRADLWARAVAQLRDEPLRGVGPGASAPPMTEEIDEDLRWAHHGYLQQAAEQGVVGLLLLLALVGWGYARLWVGRLRTRARTIAGATSVTIVAIQASVDHVLHDAAVPLTLALLVGWATVDRSAAPSNPGHVTAPAP